MLTNFAAAYESSYRTREAVSLLAKAYAANPEDTVLAVKLAALQAWFGQEKELAATRQRIQAFAEDAKRSGVFERAAKACSILPYTNRVQLEAALALGRKAVQIGGTSDRELLAYDLLALGMAEYRSGNDAAAEKALRGRAGRPEQPPRDGHVGVLPGDEPVPTREERARPARSRSRPQRR